MSSQYFADYKLMVQFCNVLSLKIELIWKNGNSNLLHIYNIDMKLMNMDCFLKWNNNNIEEK